MKNISLRKALLDDCEEIFKWRNAEETRKYFHDAKPIEWEKHVEWFHALLKNPDRHLLLGEEEGKPIGVLRYDILNNVAQISIYLVPGKAGRGKGTVLLEKGADWVRQNLPFVIRIEAEILLENLASIKAFAKAGFTRETAHERHAVYTFPIGK